MDAWNPWETLRNRSDILLEWAWLPAGHHGTVRRTGDGWVITLHAGLDRVGRRCALAHELIHVERGIVHASRATMVREEAIVRAETARRLVPCGELARTVDRMASIGIGVEARHVAAFYDVTTGVARDALGLLARDQLRRPAA